jgi:CubicO group peptidase (beta-lactamase class C family)
MATYVLVHGGGHGGWCYKKVKQRLEARGHEVFAPSLTGLAEHAHLMSRSIDLDVHIEDVVQLLRYWDLRNVIPAFGDGAAGLVSTVDDLLAFARMFLVEGTPVLSPGAVTTMTSDQLTGAQRAGTGEALLHGRSWGFWQSVITEGTRTGAFGWDGGLGTSWLVDPRQWLVVIVLTQRLWETSTPPAVHDDLQDAAYAAISHEREGAGPARRGRNRKT